MRIPIRWTRSAPLLAIAVLGGLLLLRPADVAARGGATDPVPVPVPVPYAARYQVLRNGDVMGQATVSLSREGSLWRMTSRTQGTDGLAALAGVVIVEDSLFRMRDGAPETIDYSYRQKAAWKSRERKVTVDAEAGTILSTDKERSFPFAYRAQAVDRQLVTLALALDLARGRTTDLAYRVVDRDEFDEERYRLGETGTLASAMGELRTVRVTRVRENPGRVTDSWLAIERGYVPVRILQREPDGESFELRLLSLQR